MPVLTRAKARLPQNVSTNTTVARNQEVPLFVDRSAQFSLVHSGNVVREINSTDDGCAARPRSAYCDNHEKCETNLAVGHDRDRLPSFDILQDSHMDQDERYVGVGEANISTGSSTSENDVATISVPSRRKRKVTATWRCTQEGCGAVYKDRNAFYQHKWSHRGLRCYIRGCNFGRTYANRSNLARHWKKKHPGQEILYEQPEGFFDGTERVDTSMQCDLLPETASACVQLMPQGIDFSMQVAPEDIEI